MDKRISAILTPADRSNGSIISAQPMTGSKDNDQARMYRLCYMSDGLEIIGILAMPATVDKPLPVLIFNHGGFGQESKVDGNWANLLAELAVAGQYIVLASQFRGIDGSEGVDEFAGADLNDVLNLIPLSKRIPEANAEEVVMLGISRGGVMTYKAIRVGMPLKAAAVVGAPTDLFESYAEREEGMKQRLRTMFGGTPSEVPDTYADRSPVCWPGQINVPIQIMHGTQDELVPLKQAQKLASQLNELSKPNKLVVLEDEHVLHHNAWLRNKLILEWFAQHLQR